MTQNHTAAVTGVTIEVSIIVPARNEEASLERCLRSLVEQQGIRFELIVVDDGSTDSTPAIITNFIAIDECPFAGSNPFLAGVKGLQAGTVEPGWTGKSNAVWEAAQQAQGGWLLFTDADTVHEPGSLARALGEAKEHDAVLLSYSPRQELVTLGERALMPLIFAELASRFRPRAVCDPASPVAAANGQYLLIRRDIYFAVGGHKSVAGDLLEDVALARRVKQAGGKILFRFGGEQVRTRMYRSWPQLVEGWTKNLVLLFPDARRLAWQRVSEFASIGLMLLVSLVAIAGGNTVLAGFSLAVLAALISGFILRARRSHCGLFNDMISFFGLPLFSQLLLRSAKMHENRTITWKGRVYSGSESIENAGASHIVDETHPGSPADILPVSPDFSHQENHGLPDPKV